MVISTYNNEILMDSMHRIEDFGNLPKAIDNNVLSCNRYVNICTFSRNNRDKYLIS